MKRQALVVLAVLGAAQICLAQPSTNAREECERAGLDCSGVPTNAGPLEVVGPVLWDNGAADGVNGVTSERNTVVSGTGGPEGDHGSTIADDFQLTSATTLAEIQVCLLVTSEVTSAEMYIYADAAGSPALPVVAPLVGAPTTASIVSTTYVDNTSFCPDAFGIIGRAFRFTEATTGTAISLPAGTYWLAVVGEDAGSGRAFWATSSAPIPLSSAVWGSTFFGTTYWTTTLSTHGLSDFAFRILGAPRLTAAIPALGPRGLVGLALLLGAVALVVLRLRR